MKTKSQMSISCFHYAISSYHDHDKFSSTSFFIDTCNFSARRVKFCLFLFFFLLIYLFALTHFLIPCVFFLAFILFGPWKSVKYLTEEFLLCWNDFTIISFNKYFSFFFIFDHFLFLDDFVICWWFFSPLLCFSPFAIVVVVALPLNIQIGIHGNLKPENWTEKIYEQTH